MVLYSGVKMAGKILWKICNEVRISILYGGKDMSKIDVINNKMAMFMLCEAIGEDRDTIDIKADENGLYDIKILFNGQELNVERFLENLHRSYQEAVRKQAADLISAEYDKILGKVYEIQEALEHHNKIFDEKVYI